MNIERLRLYDFRNFAQLDQAFFKGVNVLYGDNAQGKTNLLEAVYFLCNIRPARASREQELIRHERPLAFLKGVFNTRTGAVEREVTVSRENKKAVKEDGQMKHRWSELSGEIGAVFFSPEDLNLVKGEPQGRRRFLDLILYQMRPGRFKYLQGYYRVLSHRNSLLKSIKKNPSLASALAPWDEQLAELGAQLVKERLWVLDKISAMSCEFFKKFSNNTADLRLEYIDTVKYRSLETLKDDFYDLLTINRQRDIQRSFTTAGPHRDDVRFLINGYDARAFGSQGQQRLIVLCLKFAERQVFFMERGEYPIMLLDDVMSELDFFRRRQLLEPDGCQVFVTATDLNILPGEILDKSAIYRVESGQIEVK